MTYAPAQLWECPHPGCGVEVISTGSRIVDAHIRDAHGINGPLPTWTCAWCGYNVLSADGPESADWLYRTGQHEGLCPRRPNRGYEAVEHPSHYGGDTTYEVIKVLDAWGLGFSLGNAVKYIARAGRKPTADNLEDLRKAKWYLEHQIARIEESR